MTILYKDIVHTTDAVTVHASRVKIGGILPLGKVTFSKLPRLFTLLKAFVYQCIRGKATHLFDRCGRSNDSVSLAV